MSVLLDEVLHGVLQVVKLVGHPRHRQLDGAMPHPGTEVHEDLAKLVSVLRPLLELAAHHRQYLPKQGNMLQLKTFEIMYTYNHT